MTFIRPALIVLVLLSCAVSAQVEQTLLDRLLVLATPEQIQAYRELDLRPAQRVALRERAMGLLPRVRECAGRPRALFALIPSALSEVDGVLDARQRPLARKLIPRPHQIFQATRILEALR